MWYVLRDIRGKEEKGASEAELLTPSNDERAQSAQLSQREGLSQMLAMIIGGGYAVKGEDGRYYATPKGINWLDAMVFPNANPQVRAPLQATARPHAQPAAPPQAMGRPPLPPARDPRPSPAPMARPPAPQPPVPTARPQQPQMARPPQGAWHSATPPQTYPQAGYRPPLPPSRPAPQAVQQPPQQGQAPASSGEQNLQDFLNDPKRRRPYQNVY